MPLTDGQKDEGRAGRLGAHVHCILLPPANAGLPLLAPRRSSSSCEATLINNQLTGTQMALWNRADAIARAKRWLPLAAQFARELCHGSSKTIRRGQRERQSGVSPRVSRRCLSPTCIRCCCYGNSRFASAGRDFPHGRRHLLFGSCTFPVSLKAALSQAIGK